MNVTQYPPAQAHFFRIASGYFIAAGTRTK